MGIWSRAFGKESPALTLDAGAGQRFAVDQDAVDPAVFGLTSYSETTAPAARVNRKAAMQVPAVKRSRDLIAGSLGGLPLDLHRRSDRAQVRSQLFEQPERDVPRSVTMTRLYEDLLFEGIAWWRITEFGWHGYPIKVRRLDPRSVTVRKDGRVFVSKSGAAQGMAEEWVEDSELIRFESPTDGLLVAGGRAIRTALLLEEAARKHADGVPPMEYFTPADGADPAEDEDVAALLSAWSTARKLSSSAYVPAALKHNVVGWNPEQLQMADARQHAVLEIARLAGVDPEELGVSTTSRTYANQFDRRKAFIDFTLGQYRQAVEDRLSMGDVTPVGYFAKLNLSAFLRSDDQSRYAAYALGIEVGALDRSEIRDLEDKPALPSGSSVTPPADELPTDAQEDADVNASDTLPIATFDGSPAFRLDSPQDSAAFEVDVEKRTIKGLALPYGKTASSGGKLWSFTKGTLQFADVSRVKLWVNHDHTQAVGVAVELDDREDGLYPTFKVARGDAGDRVLQLAEDGVLDGFSVGLGAGPKTQLRDGVHHVLSAPLQEISLTPCPAFDDARVHSVAASAASEGKEPTMGDENTDQVAEAPDFSAITDALKAGFEQLAEQHQKDRSVVPAREQVKAGATFEVNEPLPYRFDGARGEHDFSTDIINAGKFGDSEARGRVEKFIADAFSGPRFDVDTSDVSTLNPVKQRPEMYVAKLDIVRPFYDALYAGTIDDATPFVVPKFASASGLVADHTQGVEPTPGAFTATSQTITPSPVSGKVEITREVWDQGGNPQVSGLIWREMVRDYFEALEAKAVAVLDAASPTAIPLTAGAEDDVLVNQLEAALAALQFVRGGHRFNFAGTHADLYLRLIAAVDGDGRKLLPMIGAANANGGVTSNFGAINVGGTQFVPAPALGAQGSVVESSYLVNTDDVHVWNTAPRQLTFEHRVAYVDLAIWGYVATAITRLDGVREITYDPVA